MLHRPALKLRLYSSKRKNRIFIIRARQREGIEAAKARGVRFGRPRLALPEGFSETVRAWRKGKCTAAEAAQQLGISRSTLFRRVRELERERRAHSPKTAPQPAERACPRISTRCERYVVQPRRSICDRYPLIRDACCSPF